MDEAVCTALSQAYQFAKDTKRPDGHWCGELKSNCTITAEYILLLQALGLVENLQRDAAALTTYFLSEQNEDGSWSIAPDHPGNISVTVEVYLALKILGLSYRQSQPMQRAQEWVSAVGGGVERVRVFTRVYLAQFGLLPWDAVPELPAELALMPSWFTLNIYKISSWARSTIMPLLIVSHHRPIFSLPNGRSANNNYLDELWLDSSNKHVPYHDSVWSYFSTLDYFRLGFVVVDKAIGMLGGMRTYNPLRKLALNECLKWIISRQEDQGDWAGIFPPMHIGILAYILSGYQLDDAPVRRALAAIGRFIWQDSRGKRVQACVSPVWDTVLMAHGLSAAEMLADDCAIMLRRDALHWVRQRQLLGSQGDWRRYRPNTTPGGFSFEYFNTWYPDVDDTSAAIIAFLKDDPQCVTSECVLDAVKWVLGMQCHDGGWAAFDVENDKLWLNRIPFSDMDALCDPPTPDICGRVLEAFGLLLLTAQNNKSCHDEPLRSILSKISFAAERAIRWLAKMQQSDGSWYGRWGVNYIYGTSNVLAGLAYFCFEDDSEGSDEESATSTSQACLNAMVTAAVSYLISMQNTDGGYGESIRSYEGLSPDGRVIHYRIGGNRYRSASTASQTAWALIGIVPYVSSTCTTVERGVKWLLENQVVTTLDCATMTDCKGASGKTMQGKTWDGRRYTGTGFPNHFYLGYSLYSHYFPMMALGEYLRVRKAEKLGARSIYLSQYDSTGDKK